ncbi:MAG: phosphate propanoyltransferase [Bacilli bacterium]
MEVSIGVSARHVHLCEKDFKILFSSDCELTKKSELKQKGQYACNEQVTIKGPKGSIERVRILGPLRDKTQVEISKTDAFTLGINPPVRNSGYLKDASLITIIGPCAQIEVNSAIIATRHLHITSKEAKAYGLLNNEEIAIRTSGEKSGILNNVSVIINDASSYEVHLDTDDANAFLLKTGDNVEIIK